MFFNICGKIWNITNFKKEAVLENSIISCYYLFYFILILGNDSTFLYDKTQLLFASPYLESKSNVSINQEKIRKK